ncbi:protein gustavus-like [Homalodisca vitripennis]|uniref:protein gustavus-like n=1 Tax=Homalodisca vitripennis TaxID=197043 RepID=UPI001EEAB072|nr:protein gustavus-like [Homalodisca vitripennis]KAG8310578.1 SPRY domain-containing SOCS box protein 4 [Homalodisca vitripennis]
MRSITAINRQRRNVRNWRRISSTDRRRMKASRRELRRMVRRDPGIFAVLWYLANMSLEDLNDSWTEKDEEVRRATENRLGLPTLPSRVNMLMQSKYPPATYQQELMHAWNSEDCSENIYFKPKYPLTIFRSVPTATFDAVRGKVGFSQGIHFWVIQWPIEHRGFHSMVGVATKDAPLQSEGIDAIVGSNDQSWGWNLETLTLRHNCNTCADYPVVIPSDDFEVPESFGVVLDMHEGTVGFVIHLYGETRYLGHAFTGLRGKVLFPIISTSSAPCQITMTYIGGLDSEPRSLMELCRTVVIQSIGNVHLEDKVQKLYLPRKIAEYLLTNV